MQVFAIAPSASRIPWLLLLPIGALVVAFVLLVMLLAGLRTARFELTDSSLRLRGDITTREIAWPDLEIEQVRRVDLNVNAELQPTWRMRGTAMANYRVGWFRLRNGERALLYLTDRARAVYLPTRLGYGVIVSPADPDAFVAALRRRR